MGKYKSKHHWNFRIITGTFKKSKERFFSIVEVYYNKKNIPISYGAKDLMSDHASVKNLKWVRKKIKVAFKKPILDTDNWPNKWKTKKYINKN